MQSGSPSQGAFNEIYTEDGDTTVDEIFEPFEQVDGSPGAFQAPIPRRPSQGRPRTAPGAKMVSQQERTRFRRKWKTPQVRGPERFFYDKSTFTGVHAKGGPTIVDVGRTMHTTESLMVRGAKPLEKNQAWHLAAPVLTIGNREDHRKHRFLSDHEHRGSRVFHRDDFAPLEGTKHRGSTLSQGSGHDEHFDGSSAGGLAVMASRRSSGGLSRSISDGSLLQHSAQKTPVRREGGGGYPTAGSSSRQLARASVLSRQVEEQEREAEKVRGERKQREEHTAGKFAQKWGDKPRFPERLYYDRSTYTGVYRETGGPKHYDLGKTVYDPQSLMDRRKPAVRTNGQRMDARTLPPSADEYRELYQISGANY